MLMFESMMERSQRRGLPVFFASSYSSPARRYWYDCLTFGIGLYRPGLFSDHRFHGPEQKQSGLASLAALQCRIYSASYSLAIPCGGGCLSSAYSRMVQQKSILG